MGVHFLVPCVHPNTILRGYIGFNNMFMSYVAMQVDFSNNLCLKSPFIIVLYHASVNDIRIVVELRLVYNRD